MIFKMTITNETRDKVNEILVYCCDNEVYDAIIYSPDEYKILKNVRIRYLNYISTKIEITLDHPKDLISAML